MGELDPPGTNRDLGGSGRGEKTVPEDVVGALLRFVRGNGGFSRPHPTSLSALPLHFNPLLCKGKRKGDKKLEAGNKGFLRDEG